MGKAVKAVAGIALVVFAPYVAAAMIGAMGVAVSAIGFYAIQGAVVLVGSSLVGQAFKPKQPSFDSIDSDSYAGQKLQTSKDNTSPVPQIYGQNRTGGNIIWQKTNSAISGTPNKDYWSIICVGEGEIESFLNLYVNEDTMNSLGSNKYTVTYVHVRVYTTSGTGLNLDDVEFVTDSVGTVSTGSTLGFTNFVLPSNVAFITVHQVYELTDNAHTQLDNVTFEVKGLKVKTIDSISSISVSKTYTNNPAEIILDKLLNVLNVDISTIDIPSFYNAKTKCDQYGYTCNVSFNRVSNIASNIQTVLATFRGELVYSDAKLKLKLDEKQQVSVKTITEDDILNQSLSISMKGNQEICNKLILKYVNPLDNWLSANYTIENQDLVTLDGLELPTIIDIKAVTNGIQASKLGQISFNTIRYTEDELGNRLNQTPLVVSFSTTPKNAELEIGDVFTLSHSLLDRDRKFKILTVETDQSGVLKYLSREYCETHFKHPNGSYII